jgi:galactoside O-acetyltransferase
MRVRLARGLRPATAARRLVWLSQTWRYGELGRGARVEHGTRITNRRNLFLGANAILYADCHILCDSGVVVLGASSHLAIGVCVNAVRGEVRLGAGVSVGPRSVLLAYTNHYEPGHSNGDVRRQGRVIIEDHAFIGAHVVVMPDVTIGEGAVVGAGAVVLGDVPPYTLVAGVPARVIKNIDGLTEPQAADAGIAGAPRGQG